jgi:ornithine cyclodeaminase
VRARLTPALAVEAARRALVDAHRGSLVAPPRTSVDLGSHVLVFTAGGYRDGVSGLRVYGTWPGDSDQAVLAWDAGGRLRGCVVGVELGARRTGALGAVAVDALARRDASVVAVIGSGRQARTQLWALSTVRAVSEVRVFSPDPAHREAFAEWARTDLGLAATAVPTARDAVAGAAIVVLATRSETPVVSAEWIEPGAHVTTVGPKTGAAHETPPELVGSAVVVASDSPAQAAACGEPFFTERALLHLGGILTGDHEGRRTAEDITVYCSTGLAGSEVVIAEALLASWEA